MAHIMLLGPERERAKGIRGILRKEGHRVTWVSSVDGWRDYEHEIGADLVVAALSNLEQALAAPGGRRQRFPAPLLLLQQETDFPADIDVDERIVDRMASPFLGDELLSRVDALSRVYRVVSHGNVEDPAPGSGFGNRMSSWLRRRLPRHEKPLAPYLEVAARVAEWTDRRDAFEPGHAERVTSFCAMIAEGLHLGESETHELLRAAMLHDIGKVAMPVEVLRKKGPLGESQLRLLRTHPARGRQVATRPGP